MAGTKNTRVATDANFETDIMKAGELTLVVDGATVVLGESHGLEIAPGQIHQVANRGSSAVRFLVTSSPPSHQDRIDV